MTWTKRPEQSQQPDHPTQDGRAHYVWQEQKTDPNFPGRVFIAEHPTVFEYVIMKCPKASRHVFVCLYGLDPEAGDGLWKCTQEFNDPTAARDAIEARWLTLPGYGHNPKGL